MATQIQIAQVLPTDCAAAQLRNDLIADTSRFSHQVQFSPKNSQASDSLESALRMAADRYSIPLAEIAVQDVDDEDGAYRLWVFPNQKALESSDVFGGSAWVDENCDLHDSICVVCSPIPEDESIVQALPNPVRCHY